MQDVKDSIPFILEYLTGTDIHRGGGGGGVDIIRGTSASAFDPMNFINLKNVQSLICRYVNHPFKFPFLE